jgi:hypothetical protein
MGSARDHGGGINIFTASKVDLSYEYVDMGKWVFDKGFSNGMTPEAQQTIENLAFCLRAQWKRRRARCEKCKCDRPQNLEYLCQ